MIYGSVLDGFRWLYADLYIGHRHARKKLKIIWVEYNKKITFAIRHYKKIVSLSLKRQNKSNMQNVCITFVNFVHQPLNAVSKLKTKPKIKSPWKIFIWCFSSMMHVDALSTQNMYGRNENQKSNQIRKNNCSTSKNQITLNHI